MTTLELHPPGAARASRVWRWLAFGSTLGTIAFSDLDAVVGLAPDVRTVANQFASSLTPAPYAFAIWGVIHLAFLGYAVAQLQRPARAIAVFDRVAKPWTLANVLVAGWLASVAHGYTWLAVAVMVAICGVAMTAHARATAELDSHRAPSWGRAPFSMFLGWIGIAALAKVAAALDSSGVTVDGPIALGLLALAGVFGVYVGIATRDAIVPAVVTWATVAIAVTARDTDVVAAVAALGVAIGCAATSAIILLERRDPAAELLGRPRPRRAPRLYTV